MFTYQSSWLMINDDGSWAKDSNASQCYIYLGLLMCLIRSGTADLCPSHNPQTSSGPTGGAVVRAPRTGPKYCRWKLFKPPEPSQPPKPKDLRRGDAYGVKGGKEVASCLLCKLSCGSFQPGCAGNHYIF